MPMHIIVNFLLFQLAWFACVLGAANTIPIIGVIVTALVVGWHLLKAYKAKQEATLILIAMVIGATFDQLMVSMKLIDYVHHGWSNFALNTQLVPIWIIALWAGFTTTLNVSLKWMRHKNLIAILFGGIGGPLAYFAAQKLGAVTLTSMNSFVALSIGWALITPLLLKISERFDGYSK
jgi:hypothetical protein